MWGRIAGMAALAAAVAPSGGLGMSKSGTARFGDCAVIGGDSLPLASGGSAALCSAIDRAIKAQAPTARYRVDVKVASATRLSAGLIVNGQALPEQRFAVMDGHLNSVSVEHFAHAVAAAVAEAAKR